MGTPEALEEVLGVIGLAARDESDVPLPVVSSLSLLGRDEDVSFGVVLGEDDAPKASGGGEDTLSGDCKPDEMDGEGKGRDLDSSVLAYSDCVIAYMLT